jgi:hypothetical protein
MRVDELMTIGRPHIGGGASDKSAPWWWQIRQRWAARQATRQRAAVAAFAASWDPQRETVRPLPEGTASDIAAALGTLSRATQLQALSL